jgi:hypothetical protein
MTRGKEYRQLAQWVKRNPDAWRRLTTTYLITDHPHLRPLIGTEDEAWFDAIETIDLHKNAKPLIKLLQQSSALRDHMLAELLKRYDLKPRLGRTKTAEYKLTPQHIKLQGARAHYRKLRNERVKPEAALKCAAEASGIVPDELAKYLNGKITRYRRAEQRIKALQPVG